jgi:hypothetical protein
LIITSTRPKASTARVDQLFNLLAVSDIGCDRKCFAAIASQLFRQCLNAVPPARTQDHGRTLCGEKLSRRLTETAARACYDNNFAFDVVTHLITCFGDRVQRSTIAARNGG